MMIIAASAEGGHPPLVELLQPIRTPSAPRLEAEDYPENVQFERQLPKPADPLSSAAEHAISFGRFRLLPRQRLLLEGDKALRIGSRALDVLIALVERAGDVVSKSELISCVWPNTFVAEGNLKFQVNALRRVLDDGHRGVRYVATVAGRGYCFVAPVRRVQHAGSAARATTAPKHNHNVPSSLIRLIGRAGAISTLVEGLSRHRFLAIVGPGGIGKTSAALAIAGCLLADYENGVWLIDLAPVTDTSLVPSAALDANLDTGAEHGNSPRD